MQVYPENRLQDDSGPKTLNGGDSCCSGIFDLEKQAFGCPGILVAWNALYHNG
jgi:hypothetical protein